MEKRSNLFDLTGKVAIVTGGSRGLGLEMAKAFAEQGAHVVIASRKLEACEQVAQALARDFGVRALPVAFHAGKWDDAQRLIETAEEAFGRIDILVNNAGSSPRYSSLTAIDEALWAKVLDLNLRGPFRLSTLAAERMHKAGGGSIINISSAGALQPSEHELPYAMAKSALHTMAAGMSRLYEGKVRINTLVPGVFQTDISKAWTDDMIQTMSGLVPMGRLGQPREIVGAALYLASDAASYTTGAVLKVDGGWAYSRG
ncbi:SDR family NAD(P)-dependent oxidoreductase [Ramlibacter sp. WS9]|uniref:SDR family NAD(P)-dependent oxidoreductase n=1 Tax=Ramlibacter sp. WS9 TaxID=1882741 RepID=UPI001143545D|nr:glucose 1-dehydrogenase [Ramlibacter sp. WS9]ROZ68740.1 glucose 1-dehydrogenase [Ramlibacter sp. WS9]